LASRDAACRKVKAGGPRRATVENHPTEDGGQILDLCRSRATRRPIRPTPHGNLPASSVCRRESERRQHERPPPPRSPAAGPRPHDVSRRPARWSHGGAPRGTAHTTASLKVERAGPARVTGMLCETLRRRQPAGSAVMAPHGAGPTASAAPPESIRSRRGGGGLRWGGAGSRARVGDLPVREDLPDDRRIVQRGGQAQPAPTVRTRPDVNGKRLVHESRPGPARGVSLPPVPSRPGDSGGTKALGSGARCP
jgi:hypothetical protein